MTKQPQKASESLSVTFFPPQNPTETASGGNRSIPASLELPSCQDETCAAGNPHYPLAILITRAEVPRSRDSTCTPRRMPAGRRERWSNSKAPLHGSLRLMETEGLRTRLGETPDLVAHIPQSVIADLLALQLQPA